MTKEGKAQIALKELKEYFPECQKVKLSGYWKGNDVFEAATEGLPELIGIPSAVIVGNDEVATFPSISIMSDSEFPR